MRVALIGFGSIGERHYKNLKKYTRNIFVVSKRKDIKVPNLTQSIGALSEQEPFDAIFITNETFRHISAIKECISLRPKAFFVEKPLSHNVKDLDELARNLRRKGISIWVGYNFHFFKPFMHIKDIIKKGELGKIFFIRVFVGQNLKTWRNRDYRLSYSGKNKKGGGLLYELIHDINYPSWLLDDILIPKTFFTRKLSSLEIDSEDIAESIFISKKGVIVSIHQDFIRIPAKRSIEIIGSNGSLCWDSIKNTVKIDTIGQKITKKIIVDKNEMYIKELDFFFEKLKDGGFFTNIDEAIRDVKNVELLYGIKK